jgi:hypothetical protein
MKNKILPTLAFAAALISTDGIGQKSKTYAITSETKGSFNWSILREVDLSTGDVVRTLYDKSTNKNVEITTHENLRIANSNKADLRLSPMAEGVAAAAYDARNNRLYYTCMRGTDLRFFDLNSSEGKVVYQTKAMFEGNRYNEANVITRMAFASDGYGYALTNDGNHLIKFATDQKAATTDLGAVLDGKKNGSISIHNQCSSWGGDMVGDAYGNLYVITYRNYLFRINPQTKIADLVGQVKGLPLQFTSNGMAVNDEGELVLSSAMVSDNYYKLNPSSLEATPLKNNSATFNASDLANSNLLFQNNAAPKNIFAEVKGNNAISIYPNPVTLRTFTVQFDKVAAGKYNLALMDAAGRNVVSRSITINALGQVERINLPRTSAGGMYLVKLTGNNSKVFFSDKIVVQ